MAYTYDVAQIGTNKKDRMRFELGDTDISGGADTCMLADEEIKGILAIYPSWKRAKFALVESVYMRFAKEVTTSVGGLSQGYQERAKHWADIYNQLKKELCGMAAPKVNVSGPPSFSMGMMDNPGDERK